MEGIFSREARHPAYALLRNIMIRTKGAASIQECILDCSNHGLVVDRSMIASARNQYKRMANAASMAGEPMPVPVPVPVPVMPVPVVPVPVVEEIPALPIPKIEGEWFSEYVPNVDNTYKIDLKTKKLFDTVEKLSIYHFKKNKHSLKVRMVGAAGCGKTSGAIQFAAIYRRPAFVIDCPTLREPLDLFGTRNVEDMKTIFSESLFLKAISVPRAVIVFDEMNRIPSNVLNIAMPLLDYRGEMYLDLAKRNIKVGAGVTMFASMNEGREYTGTEEVDEAIKNRFSTIVECTYLNPEDEANLLVERYGIDANKAIALAEVARINRDKYLAGEVYSKSISTRLLENAAEMLQAGGDSTLLNTIGNHFPEDGTGCSERKSIMDLFKGKGFKV